MEEHIEEKGTYRKRHRETYMWKHMHMEARIEEKGTCRERHVHIEAHIYGGTYM